MSNQQKPCIGITGGIGSGKSTALMLFAKLGVTTISADQIAQQLLTDKKTISKIATKFSNEILTKENLINKNKLREICFNNQVSKQWLENLLHPTIFTTINNLIVKPTTNYYLVEIPLLFETQLPFTITRSCVIDTTKNQQISRTMQRSNLTKKIITKIIESQMPRESRLVLADDVLDNTRDISHLEDQVIKMHGQYLSIGKNKC